MATWRETMSMVSAHAPQLAFGDRSKIAKELWALRKSEARSEAPLAKVDRVYRWLCVFAVVCLATALVLQGLLPKTPLSTGVRLRDIQKLVAEIPPRANNFLVAT